MPVPTLLCGVMDMAVLKPTLPVSVLQAARLSQFDGPGGMILMSYHGCPDPESTENSATTESKRARDLDEA